MGIKKIGWEIDETEMAKLFSSSFKKRVESLISEHVSIAVAEIHKSLKASVWMTDGRPWISIDYNLGDHSPAIWKEVSMEDLLEGADCEGWDDNYQQFVDGVKGLWEELKASKRAQRPLRIIADQPKK